MTSIDPLSRLIEAACSAPSLRSVCGASESSSTWMKAARLRRISLLPGATGENFLTAPGIAHANLLYIAMEDGSAGHVGVFDR